LLVSLADRPRRADAVRAIASLLGVESLWFLVRDAELGVLLPAPGLPQTLPGGPAWKAFVDRCLVPGRHEGRVDLPKGTDSAALGIAGDGMAMVLVGGSARAGELAQVERFLPMFAGLLAVEQECILARADATVAKDATSRAFALATALEASRAESARLNAQLREEHERKDEFLAMLGHELRNPLAALVSAIELTRMSPPPSPASLARNLDVMGRQVGQLTGLVAELLDVSRVSRGRIEEILEDAIDEARPLFDARGQRLMVSLDDEPLAVKADPLRLTQVFGNLLNNAAKYSDTGTKIELSVRKEGSRVAIRVADEGIGIASDMLPRIFDLFTQGPVSHDRAQGGLGIGLTLVRTLVELHGGHVVAESAGLGRGSVFTVHLPLIAAQDIPARAHARHAAPVAGPVRVLVVDDNRDAADSLAALLQMTGHISEVAYSGKAALTLAEKGNHDLVLLDIGLPEMDGYEVARKMKPMVRKGARLVALSGYGGEDRMRESSEAGFFCHLVKPVGLDDLNKVLKGVQKGA
jgi:signal transduction histidine kinase/CheY-like chemotaxis protein